MPYWDWAEDATVPDFMGDSEITVEGPDGPETLDNPLYSFVFPEKAVSGAFGRIISGDRDPSRTSRCPPAEANKRLSEVNLKGMVVSGYCSSKTFGFQVA
jgi:hypothetical protein